MAPYRRYRRSLPSTKALTAKIVALAVAGALVIGAVISVEMAGGNDPALGQKATAAKKSSAATSAGSGSSSSGYSYSPPVTSSTS